MKVLKPSGKILFKEVQQFRQVWLWAIIILSTIPTLVITSIALPQDKNMSTGGVIAVISLVAGIAAINLVLLYVIKFETIVSEEGIYFRWQPFMKKYIVLYWNEVSAVMIKKYPYLKYGYHIRPNYGRVHNVNGNMGALFKLRSGKQYYIGTQKLKALQHALEQMKPVTVVS